jgi:hypothetical protein
MKQFTIGEQVVYYPRRENEQDNLHLRAEVKGITKAGRYRVTLVTGKRMTVTARYLERQMELPL